MRDSFLCNLFVVTRLDPLTDDRLRAARAVATEQTRELRKQVLYKQFAFRPAYRLCGPRMSDLPEDGSAQADIP